MKMALRNCPNRIGNQLCFPTFAQQKETVDPKIKQQIRVLAAEYDEAINKHDAAAVAALYTGGRG